jgi:branched-chain amino acid transport system permease protein
MSVDGRTTLPKSTIFTNESWWKIAFLILLALVLVSLPLFAKTSVVRLITASSILALFAMAWNLTLGATGIFSFGHGGLFGIGMYTVAIMMVKFSIPFSIAFVCAPLLAGLASCIIGIICIRLTGLYFSILTLAFSQLIWSFLWKARDLTGGDDGLSGTTAPLFISSPSDLYYFVISIVVLSIVLIWCLLRSPLGFTLNTIRENPTRAEAIGLDVARYRILAFTLSGFFAGIAGALEAMYMRGAYVEFASVGNCFDPVFMCILGGIWVFAGPIVGAFIWLALDHYIPMFTEYWPLIAGIILILMVLFMPMGALGSTLGWWRNQKLKKSLAFNRLTVSLSPSSASSIQHDIGGKQ